MSIPVLAAPTIDMYRDSDRIRIDMGNGRFLSRLTWLTPYMYYFDLFRYWFCCL